MSRHTKLRDEREALIRIEAAATRNPPDSLHITDNGSRIDVLRFLPSEPIRSEIIETAGDRIVAIDKELKRLGVCTPEYKRAEMDAEVRTAEMYLRAWIRSLGG